MKRFVVVLLTIAVLAFGVSAQAGPIDHGIKPTNLPTSH